MTSELTREASSLVKGNSHCANHSVQFYAEDCFLVESLSRHLSSMLGNGGAAVVIATRAHCIAIADRLQAMGLDLAAAHRDGRYIDLDAGEVLGELMVDDWPDFDIFSKVVGKVVARAAAACSDREAGVAAFGEIVDILCASGRMDAAIRVEELWNDLIHTQPLSLYCAYSLEWFDREAHAAALREVCAQHSEVLPGEGYLQLKTEQERFRYVVQLQQEAGALKTEIRERQRAQEALVHAEKGAAVGRLAASIAHEINNPLTSLTNLLYLLQVQSAPDSSVRQYASLADLELRRISRITKQMLGFYRDSSSPVFCKLSDVADGVLEIYEAQITRNRISVDLNYSAEGVIEGFPSEMRQLFANLIGNAIEAAGVDGKIRVRISNARSWTNPKNIGVRVSIADNGTGIPAANRLSIFEPFFSTKEESGTGLGLWVCRGIVQKHHGKIRFRSKTENGRLQGTTFSVFLPIRFDMSR
jgi:signal transduction histidine kinase